MYTLGEKIVPRDIEEEIKDSYLSYAMSVIVGRALPDVRDGLKPVHRRILYGMQELDLEELEKASASAKAQFAELYEASEIEAQCKKLEKLDLSLEEYFPQDSKPAFKLTGENAQRNFAGLHDVLLAVQEEGRQGGEEADGSGEAKRRG